MTCACKEMAIPKAIKEQVWLRDNGRKFDGKCKTRWCSNKVTVFDFHCGHDIPASKGGATTMENIVVLCARCNLSMSNTYTFQEWNRMNPTVSCWKSCTAVSPV
jgi:5-methylcytosine-specific restriction endonuclease McrA